MLYMLVTMWPSTHAAIFRVAHVEVNIKFGLDFVGAQLIRTSAYSRHKTSGRPHLQPCPIGWNCQAVFYPKPLTL
jgi:hypothetical protein